MPKSTLSKSNRNTNSVLKNVKTYLSNIFNTTKFAYIFVFLTVVIWGLATPITKATIEEVPPMTFLMLRLWIMAIILIIPTIYYFRKYNIDRNRLLKILGGAVIGSVFTLFFYFQAMARTSSTEASIITTTYPLVVSVFGVYILHEVLIKKQIEGLLIAFIGILIIVLEPIILHITHIDGSKIAFIGNILLLMAVLFDATYSIYVKKYIVPDKIITPFMLISISFVFASIVFTPIGIREQYKMYTAEYKDSGVEMKVCDAGVGALNAPTPDETEILQNCEDYNMVPFDTYFVSSLLYYLSPPRVYGILYMALFSGILAYTFYNKGLEKIDASKVSVFYYLQPLIAVPVSMAFLGDKISFVFVIGAGLVIVGVCLVEKHR